MIFFVGIFFPTLNLHAQQPSQQKQNNPELSVDTLKALADTITAKAEKSLENDSIHIDSLLRQAATSADSLLMKHLNKKNRKQFVPDPKRALWLSLVFPGAGQIYNRKFWKLPIVYGGFLGCTYALLWNQQMYKDYSQAYIDIMDDDPNTASYNKMLPLGYSIEGREDQFKTIFKHKKDFYRRYRDLSIFAFIGVYLISVVDAYVDAQLSTFDISKDLSLQVEPAVFQQKKVTGNTRAVGLQCCFKFK